MNILINKTSINISLKENTKKVIICVSHERSGTHFLMNSISCNSHYTVNPFLNFDNKPFGDVVNFFDNTDINNFFNKIAFLKKNQKNFGLASIVKSHHMPNNFDKLFDNDKFIFINIFRDPFDTLLSFWKFIWRWDHHEGPKTESLFKFLSHKPEGQMLRYQLYTYDTIFDRWANHINSWYEYSQKYNNIIMINYRDLKNNFLLSLNKLLTKIEIPSKKIIEPNKENYFKGSDLNLLEEDKEKSKEYILNRINKYPSLLSILS